MFTNKVLFLVVFILVQQTNFILSDCVHGDLYVHSSNCRLFYQCAHGRLFELHCPNGLYFNPEENVCDWPRNVNCDRKTTQTTLTPTTPTPITPSIPSTTTELTPSTPAPHKCQWEPGQEIVMGNRCEASDGYFVFQFDGNAVIYDRNNIALWNSETAGTGHRFVFQTDGNLVMYSITGTAVWNSRTHNQGGTLLIFQEDRNLVIYTSDWVALWNSRTHVPPTTTTPSTTTPSTTTPSTTTPSTTTPSTTTSTTTTTPSTTPAPQICQWEPDQDIVMGNRCDVPDGFFEFQIDGNAVIYDRNNIPLWYTATTGSGHRFVFQTDGNLVMYSISGTAVWNSGTQGGSLLVFQPDRNLVIYNSSGVALWNSGTHVA